MCLGSQLQKVIELTPTPPGNNFLDADEVDQHEPRYPLDVYFCAGCHHVQLGHVVDPKILYQNDYTYVSATSSRFVQHLREYAEEMIRRHGLRPETLVADIGSNDGTCLRFFKEGGMTVAGVDPATEIARRASAAGIPTVGDFFSLGLARTLREQHGPAALITSHNACAHIDDLDDVIQGVRHWLADDGVFVVEVGYLLDVYQNVWFDTIYHEHLDYHSVDPFGRLFERHGMEVVGVERVSPQGGSIRVTAQKVGGPRRPDGSFAKLVALERAAGLDKAETFVEYGRRIDAVGADLRSLVSGLKAEGRSIAGYGAATKATTLLSHFRIGKEDVDFIADDNPLKQGLFSPATHIPVVEPGEIYRARPDYLLILAWNFAESIMAAHQPYQVAGGRFILPMPEARVIA
jgi:SAM-dependent methyltransferase